MHGWDYTDTYVAACGQCFSSHVSGRNHEKHCGECQSVIRREPLEDEENDDERDDDA